MVSSQANSPRWDSTEEHNFQMATKSTRKNQRERRDSKVSTPDLIDSPKRIVNLEKIRNQIKS